MSWELTHPQQARMIGHLSAAWPQGIWTPSRSFKWQSDIGTRVLTYPADSVLEPAVCPPTSFLLFFYRNRSCRWDLTTYQKNYISKPRLQILVAMKLSSGQWNVSWNHTVLLIVTFKSGAPENGFKFRIKGVRKDKTLYKLRPCPQTFWIRISGSGKWIILRRFQVVVVKCVGSAVDCLASISGSHLCDLVPVTLTFLCLDFLICKKYMLILPPGEGYFED